MLALFFIFSVHSFGATERNIVYTLPSSNHPIDEIIFTINQISSQINERLRNSSIQNALKLRDEIETLKKLNMVFQSKYGENQKRVLSVIKKNIELLGYLQNLDANTNLNLELEIKNLHLDNDLSISSYNELFMDNLNPPKVGTSQLNSSYQKLKSEIQSVIIQFNTQKNNPDQLRLGSARLKDILNRFIKKYDHPFYLTSDLLDDKKCVVLDLKKIKTLHNYFSFYRNFFQEERSNNYLSIIEQDLYKVRVGHATESAKNFQIPKKFSANNDVSLKNLQVDKPSSLEKVNKDRNI